MDIDERDELFRKFKKAVYDYRDTKESRHASLMFSIYEMIEEHGLEDEYEEWSRNETELQRM